jgi:hypothetical protein
VAVLLIAFAIGGTLPAAAQTDTGIVGRILNDPTFGQLLSQADPRQWQFGARFVF